MRQFAFAAGVRAICSPAATLAATLIAALFISSAAIDAPAAAAPVEQIVASELAPTATPTPTTRSISIFGRRFDPVTVRVTVGSTLIWRNGDRIAHTITGNIYRDPLGRSYDLSPNRPADRPAPPVARIDSGASPLPARPNPPLVGEREPPAEYAYVFQAAGIYSYRCTIHPQMNGTIIVDGAPSTNPGQTIPAPTATTVLAQARTVSIFGHRFLPSTLRVVEGATVTWRNGDREVSAVQSDRAQAPGGGTIDDPYESDTLSPRPAPTPGVRRSEGGSFSHVFRQAGRYTYYNPLDPSMRGSVIVRRIDGR